MLQESHNQSCHERGSWFPAKDLISMTTRRSHASRTSTTARFTAALSRAWQSARLADRHVMEIRTEVSRYAS